MFLVSIVVALYRNAGVGNLGTFKSHVMREHSGDRGI